MVGEAKTISETMDKTTGIIGLRIMIRREFGTRDKEGTEERKERLFY
jgi:hypothetical protein